jgi:hypothetical protein
MREGEGAERPTGALTVQGVQCGPATGSLAEAPFGEALVVERCSAMLKVYRRMTGYL